ncbi:DUF2846 domain-containing protein [Arsukibacterium sp.]|uniref:DUF2846 domain-containing protein n=1 Tax=Arsukibacterium sp. TaxID=1977258 RepID=UPI00299DECA7|nr:DUF2846 domain-containing protein [Arsukibacterium sp.]MDX1537064.1 DUF2846 domain-containing protein [Arsukibacterium sp.]
MIKKLVLAATLLASIILTGCASVPMATPEMDSQAKQFTTVPDKAKIYIYRDETMGAAVKMPVLLNGMSVGDTVAKSYILREVEPGEHTILSKTENDAELTLTANAGTNYYVWQEVKMGAFAARSKLHLVDEAKGQKSVNACKLVK